MEGINAYIKAIQIYNENGKFGQAGRVHKDVAEIFEKDSNFTQAIDHYQQVLSLNYYR